MEAGSVTVPGGRRNEGRRTLRAWFRRRRPRAQWMQCASSSSQSDARARMAVGRDGNPTPRARDPAERRVLAFVHRLNRAALARNAPAGRTLKFN